MVVVVAAMVCVSPASAQTRQQKKDAKKEAKRLTKEGYLTMGLPLQRQLEDYYVKMSQADDEGMPIWLEASSQAIGNSYSTAQMEAVNVAKVRLAQQVRTTVMSQAKVDLANASLSSDEAASITKALEKSTLLVGEKLNRVVAAQQYYRVLKNKNYEVHVVLLYSAKAMRDMILQDARQTLQAEMDDFKPVYEDLLSGTLNNAVR